MSSTRPVGHRRQDAPRTHVGRIVLLGASIGVSLALAVTSFLVPGGGANASTGQAAIAAATLATESLPSAAVAEAQAADQATKKKAAAKKAAPAVPADSGSGRRIVFDQSDQRVWLVESDGTVDRTYLVSGSRFDNLDPGTFKVLSRQRHATSFDYTGTMEYFVHFTTGWSAPIGFHAIPIYNDGTPEQTVEQLGEPLSAGCIRQEKSDAKYLWDWAPVGTTVVVTA